ncbi:hypothetical protein [Deinococcus sp. KNUC1210]|uniref:hypothetical protein n=1 Tax=Deinococcus sp. KNUC1210 TaxID=2917691 RepID=UPI00351D40CF
MWTHAATEDMLARTGLAFTALRNGFYADSAQFLLDQAAHTGSVNAPQDGPVSWTTHADLAEAAASVLLDEGRFEGPTPPLVADEALDLAQLGQLLSSLTGTPIQRVVISELDYRQTLATRGLPSERIDVMMGLFTAAARGEFISQDPTLSTLLAHPPQRMDQVLRQQNAG